MVVFRQRSPALLHHARAIKRMNSLSKHKVASMYSRLAGAWNAKCGLRFGDKAVALGPAAARTAAGRVKRVTKRKWDVKFVMRKVYEFVGQAEVPRGGVGQTMRTLESLSAMANLNARTQREAIRKDFFHADSDTGVVLQLAFGATPLLVDLGMLGPLRLGDESLPSASGTLPWLENREPWCVQGAAGACAAKVWGG